MLRAVLEFILMLVVARTFWRLVGGVMEGLGGPGADRRVPQRGGSRPGEGRPGRRWSGSADCVVHQGIRFVISCPHVGHL